MQPLSTVSLWTGSMAWHLWRMLTGRPAYKNLGDTRLTAWSFVAVFFAAAMLRWTVLGPYKATDAVVDQVLIFLVLMFLAERSHRSSGLVCAFLGISAAVDLVVCLAYWFRIFPSVELVWYSNSITQIALMMIAYFQFLREPAEVQAKGYRATKKPPF